jgi:hypothetical protein
MQRLGDDIVNRKLPRLWRLSLCILPRSQTDAITQSMSSPETCSHWGDNRAPASPWGPLETSSAMGGPGCRAEGSSRIDRTAEISSVAMHPIIAPRRVLDTRRRFIRFTSLTTHNSNNHDTRSPAHGKRVAHSQFNTYTIDGRGSTVLETFIFDYPTPAFVKGNTRW